jgi:hypothetical protein
MTVLTSNGCQSDGWRSFWQIILWSPVTWGKETVKKGILTFALYKKPAVCGISASPLSQSHTALFLIPCKSFAPGKL